MAEESGQGATRTAKKTAAPATVLAQQTTDRMDRQTMEALRAPFPEEVVGKLPRLTCRACSSSDRKRCDDHTWINHCADCGGGHSSAAMHLDYVGHAAVTDRLLAIDPEWTWEPMGVNEYGLPMPDNAGNLWIKLTIKGVTRIGVGDAKGDSTGSGAKVLVGDALRNAAMRFGVALDLWSKQDLAPVNPRTDPVFLRMMLDNITDATTRDELREIATRLRSNLGLLSEEDRAVVNEAWLAKRNKMGDPK